MKTKPIHFDGDELTLKQLPKYNGFGGGYGPHKNKKRYNRKQKHKKDFYED